MAVFGLDVSYAQKSNFDWKAVEKSDLKFAVAKCTDGFSIDSQFKRNFEEMNKISIIRGFYHWYVPYRPAKAQAAHFIKTAGEFTDDMLPPCLDFEDDGKGQYKGQQLLDGFIEFLLEVERLSGRKPIIYCGKYWWSGNVQGIDSEIAAQYPLWHARYISVPKKTTDYKTYAPTFTSSFASPWESRGIKYALVQWDGDGGAYSPDGKIDIDVNVFESDEYDFQKFIKSTKSGKTIFVPYMMERATDMQLALLRLGYDIGSSGADGKVGSKTRAALKLFQEAAGLDATGEATPETLETLKQSLYSSEDLSEVE